MKTTLITQEIWSELTRAVRAAPRRCAVAVAYFGAGARDLLPLEEGSRLVVDASERAIASGQTCPAELARLVKRGVRVYSVPNLHAKVFVIGRTAYVGSQNVSASSASRLVEAAIRTTEPTAVNTAQQFVLDNCLHELTPVLLKQLAKLYRPPQIPGGKKGRRQPQDRKERPTLPRLYLAQLHRIDWSDRDQKVHDKALKVANKRRQHPRTFDMESFRMTGILPYKRRDVVIQVTDEGRGKVLVTAPGNVLHIRADHRGNRKVSFVYLECPSRRRRDAKALANAIGRGAVAKLQRGGLIHDAGFAQALLKKWAE